MRLLNFLNPYHLSEAVRKKEPLAVQREIILQFLLIATTIWGVASLIIYLLRTRITSANLQILPFALTIGILVVLTIARRIPYQVRSYGLALLILIKTLETLLREGLIGEAMVYGIAFAAVIAVLIGSRAGSLAALLLVALQSLVGWAMITGRLVSPDVETLANFSLNSNAWISSVLSVLLVITTISAAFFQLTRGLSSALDSQKKMTADLQKERDLLETRVSERTRQLTRKALHLEAAQQVASVLAHETSTYQLLTTAVDVIKEKFGFYHAGIFLNDRENGYTILEASTGSAGKKMLENKHRLRIGAEGIVGYVAGRGEPRITADVLDDPNYYPNPLLPDTRAEMAVPLLSGDQPIGVLDIQSTIRDAFTADDVEVLSAIANQLSLALEKAQLVKDLETSLAELEATIRLSTAQTWQTHLRTTRKRYAFQYKQARVQSAPSLVDAETGKALGTGGTVIAQKQNDDQNETIVAIPIKLRGQPLGVIQMSVAGSKVSPELIRLAESAVNRLAISLENVRLLEELQVRAERERLVGEISSKVRTATDVDTILRTAANEIGRSLGVSEVVVQLNPGK